MGAMNKKLADMTPEELESYKGRLDGMARMVDGARQAGNVDVANQIEETIAGLRDALGKNDLVAGQTHKDKLAALMQRLGRPRGNGEGGDRARRGGNGGGGEDGGRRGN